MLKKKKSKTQNGISLYTKWLKKKKKNSSTPNADEAKKKLNHLCNAGRNPKYKQMDRYIDRQTEGRSL